MHMSMIRKAYLLRKDQIESLSSIPGNDSEHVRAAIDEYVAKKKGSVSSPSRKVKNSNISASPSL